MGHKWTAGTATDFTATISWGDGSADTTLNLGAGVLTFSTTHQYLDNQPGNAPFTISVTVTDKGERIEVVYSGRNNKNDEKISLKFSVSANGARLTKASGRERAQAN